MGKKSYFPLLTPPSIHLQSLSSIREGNSGSKTLNQQFRDNWAWKVQEMVVAVVTFPKAT